MRFVESPLKYLLLPLVPITAIGIVEFVELTREETTCCVVDPTTDVRPVVEVIKPAPPAPPAPCTGPCGTAPPA
ncbi:MAG: hypothetical protein H0V17_29780 [Deltaproteobacteria bacterium]|nr:hypothetical protein [Deltaproteobacteria bacterium]